ncbi:hypothetical protein [Rhodococcus globerulus]|uniref:hypothetical protein n=1 Tax=Rhodococcus globerulus TaxID=33008 RepID=UPI00301A34A6
MRAWNAALSAIGFNASAPDIAAGLNEALDAARAQVAADRSEAHALTVKAGRPARSATIAAARRMLHDVEQPADPAALDTLLLDVGIQRRPPVNPADTSTIPADERRALAAILARAHRIDRDLRRQPAAPAAIPAALPPTLDAARRAALAAGRSADAYRTALRSWIVDIERTASALTQDTAPLLNLYGVRAEQHENAARRAGRPTDPPAPIAHAWADYATIGRGGREVLTACQRARAAL